MASAWASLMIVAAISSSDQPWRGRSCASVRWLARVTTVTCCSGGKAPGATGAGGILQPGEPLLAEALAPAADGVAVATELVGDLQVAGLVGVGAAEHEAAAPDQRLRRGVGADERFQVRPL